jgi:DNA invertase Pin-like site-specific DNA recombinase
MHDARRGQYDVLLVWAFDRLARSLKHFLEVLDELTHLNVEFISFRENVDTSGPLGRAMIVIIGAIAELERNLIIERVRSGMRRASSKDGGSAGRRSMWTAMQAALVQNRPVFNIVAICCPPVFVGALDAPSILPSFHPSR